MKIDYTKLTKKIPNKYVLAKSLGDMLVKELEKEESRHISQGELLEAVVEKFIKKGI